MGRQLQINWQESVIALKALYQKERNSERGTLLLALWHLRCGKNMKDVAKLVGIAYRTFQYWVACYRRGGLTEVLQRIKGHGNQSRPLRLNPLQQQSPLLQVPLGCFRAIWDAMQWVRNRWRVQYSYTGLHSCLKT